MKALAIRLRGRVADGDGGQIAESFLCVPRLFAWGKSIRREGPETISADGGIGQVGVTT